MGLSPGALNAKELVSPLIYLKDIAPDIIQSPRYYSTDNFLGRRVVGYEKPVIMCTVNAARHLKRVQQSLYKIGYSLVVYDGYRPLRAEDNFLRWSKNPKDVKNKQYYYPTLDKKDIFTLGYVAKYSAHVRGSAFDLTIIKWGQKVKPIVYSIRQLKDGTYIPFLNDNTVDMGSSFDLFHQVSHHDSPLVEDIYIKRRNLLRNVMEKYGFVAYKKEWWHYRLKNEPYPHTYFDSVVR